MQTFTATEAGNNIGKLWETAATEPVMVKSAGKPFIVVMSAQEYDRLTGKHRKRRVAGTGTGANLLANVDVDALLATPIDDAFADYL